MDVFFDDLRVTHVKSPIIATSDYYPFGLETANSYTRENAVPNRYKFQEKEWQDELGLNLYDFGWRQYDPVIGRTTIPDPHSYNYWELSPYSFLGNNPINVLDPLGMDTVNVNNVDMSTFDPENDVVMLDEAVVVTADRVEEPQEAKSQDQEADNQQEVQASDVVLPVIMQMPQTGALITLGRAVVGGVGLTIGLVFTPVAGAGEGEMEALERMRLEARQKDLEKERERLKSKNELERAQEQLEGIEEAQGRAKKETKEAKQSRINSIEKSKQNMKTQLKRIKSRDDLLDD